MKKITVLMIHGGVGDFLFQLDLAKRLELNGVTSVFLFRSNYIFLTDIIKNSNISNCQLIKANNFHYPPALLYVWFLAIFNQVTIINSFNYTFLKLPTRLFYWVTKTLGARIIVCQKQWNNNSYEQVLYKDNEMIWQRNNRIIEKIVDKKCDLEFPIIDFKISNEPNILDQGYIHIHPVGSKLQKSYPAKKLLDLLRMFNSTDKILITMTPKEESWYLTDDLRAYIKTHNNISFISKKFSFMEIKNLILNAQIFCTVNTGLLWLAIMLKKSIVVCDTFTDYEWNPVPYGNTMRLCHDYDDEGQSLHLKLNNHEDGVYFESMYQITSQEIFQAISVASNYDSKIL
jgi:hypothetical protein